MIQKLHLKKLDIFEYLINLIFKINYPNLIFKMLSHACSYLFIYLLLIYYHYYLYNKYHPYKINQHIPSIILISYLKNIPSIILISYLKNILTILYYKYHTYEINQNTYHQSYQRTFINNIKMKSNPIIKNI